MISLLKIKLANTFFICHALQRYKQEVICQGEGPIFNAKWRGRFAAWITNKVSIQDLNKKRLSKCKCRLLMRKIFDNGVKPETKTETHKLFLQLTS